MQSKYDQGYNAFFNREKYNTVGMHTEWHRGFTAAERHSRCGWYNKNGTPNRRFNKQ
jgi:hypothetical protein